jgi:membrane protein DedA with SNARE-associated domain
MLHWLHSILPHIPRYGFVLIFIVVFLNNIGFPLPGETILLGAGFFLGSTSGSVWPPIAAGSIACFIGGICAFGVGRRLGKSSLKDIGWLHLTDERMRWPERFFARHGSKTVLVARFVPLFPPVAVNLLAGMSKIPWKIFLLYDLAGSGAYTLAYIFAGYFFGKKWKLLEAWIGPTTLHLFVAGVAIVALAFVFRRRVRKQFQRLFA